MLKPKDRVANVDTQVHWNASPSGVGRKQPVARGAIWQAHSLFLHFFHQT